MTDRLGKLIPLEDLTPDQQRMVTPGSPNWKDYAARLETDNGLPAGTLNNIHANFKPTADMGPREFLDAVAGNKRYIQEQGLPDPLPRPGAPAPAVPASVAPTATAPSAASAVPVPLSAGDRAGAQAASIPVPQPTVPGYNFDANPAHGGYDFHPFGIDALPSVHLGEDIGNAAAGFGKSYADTLQGLKQRLGLVSQSDVDATRQQDAPLMDTKAGMAANVGGQISQVAMPAGAFARAANTAGKVVRAAGPLGQAAVPLSTRVAAVMNPYAQAAIVSGGQQATQPLGTGENLVPTVGRAAAEGVLGAAPTTEVARFLRPAVTTAGPDTARAAQSAQAFGIPLTAPQVSSNKATQLAGKIMDPFNAGSMTTEKQGAAYNQTIARMLGENGGTPAEQLKATSLRLSGTPASPGQPAVPGEFDRILASKPTMQIDPWHEQMLRDTADQFALTHPGTPITDPVSGESIPNPAVVNQWEDLKNRIGMLVGNVDPATGEMPTKAYHDLRIDWGNDLNALESSSNKDPRYATALRNLRDTADNIFTSQITPENAQAYTTANRQFNTMKTLEPVLPTTPDTPWEPGAVIDALRNNPSTAHGMYFGSDKPFTTANPYSPTTFNPHEYADTNTAVKLGEVAGLASKNPGWGQDAWKVGSGEAAAAAYAAYELEKAREPDANSELISMSPKASDANPGSFMDSPAVLAARDVAGLGVLGILGNRYGVNSNWFYNGMPRVSSGLTALTPYTSQLKSESSNAHNQTIPSGGLPALLPPQDRVQETPTAPAGPPGDEGQQ